LSFINFVILKFARKVVRAGATTLGITTFSITTLRHDRTSRQPTNLKQDVSIPVPPVPFLTSW
jgi:hypothetical protein